MAIASNYLNLLQNAQAQVESLGLEFGSSPVTVIVVKTARWLPNIGLPSLPIIIVAGDDRRGEVTPFTTEGNDLVKYPLSVVLIAAGGQDNTANMDIWLNWYEQERQLFQWGMQAQFPNCFFSEYVPDPPILKEAFLKNYDVSGFGFMLWNVETKGQQQAQAQLDRYEEYLAKVAAKVAAKKRQKE